MPPLKAGHGNHLGVGEIQGGCGPACAGDVAATVCSSVQLGVCLQAVLQVALSLFKT